MAKYKYKRGDRVRIKPDWKLIDSMYAGRRVVFELALGVCFEVRSRHDTWTGRKVYCLNKPHGEGAFRYNVDEKLLEPYGNEVVLEVEGG